MLTELRLEQFKSFREATLPLSPFTLLIGANATGKSNVRDALRFLHGIGRGYTLAEILGEKWIEGGVLQWRGIRGGTREVAHQGAPSFALEAAIRVLYAGQPSRRYVYRVEVLPSTRGGPRIANEWLREGEDDLFRTTHTSGGGSANGRGVRVTVTGKTLPEAISLTLSAAQPVLSQMRDALLETAPQAATTASWCRRVTEALASMRFMDPDPDAMRTPSIPGQTTLGDRGENLSSVLLELCRSPKRKQTLLSWLQELTPMDPIDLKFPADATGRVSLALVERDGRQVSAQSASDGTLRFLVLLAALLEEKPPRLYFFEELDAGIHPNRVSLLVELIEQRVAEGKAQVIATSHSPQMLAVLPAASLADVVLTYRLEGEAETGASRLVDIPDASRVLAGHDVAHLHAAGWFEDAAAFTAKRAHE